MRTSMLLRWIEQAEAQRVRRDIASDHRATPSVSETAGEALAAWLAQVPPLGARTATEAAGSIDRPEPRF